MKADIFELRQNEREYQDLFAEFSNVDRRYNILQEDKVNLLS